MDVEREHRYDHTYHCPNCGHPMLPRLGEHNAKCFAHDKNHKCGVESYIHSAAKVILAKRFNERAQPFKIGFAPERPCKKSKSCRDYDPYRCNCRKKILEYDLSIYYDLPAEIEVDLMEPDGETHFRPDVLLKSADPKRQDIFLEVYHKHKSSKEKIASGHQIIEIRVKNMFDLPSLATIECFMEGKDVDFYGFKPSCVTPDQIVEDKYQIMVEQGIYGVADSSLPVCKQSAEYKRMNYHLQRLVIYRSGKTYQTGVYEYETDKHHPTAVMDITFERRYHSYDYQRILARKDNRARFCDFCEHCIRWGITENVWCNIGKNGSKQKNTFNKMKGTQCPYFVWRKSDDDISAEKLLVEGVDYVIWFNPKYESGIDNENTLW